MLSVVAKEITSKHIYLVTGLIITKDTVPLKIYVVQEQLRLNDVIRGPSTPLSLQRPGRIHHDHLIHNLLQRLYLKILHIKIQKIFNIWKSQNVG